METKKKIVIVANFCDYGEEKSNNRFNYIAELLVESGFEVELITSTFSHRSKQQRELVEGEDSSYKTTLIYEPTYQKNVSLTRFRSHKVWANGVAKYLKSAPKADLVYCAIPSLNGPYAVAKYCKKNEIPFVVDIQDLWPEAFKLVLKLPVVSDILFAPMTWRANYVYKAADRILAVSETYKERGLSVNKKDCEGRCVFLGTDLEAFDKKVSSHKIDKPEDELWIGYAGTLGHSYNIEIIISALNLIADQLPQKVVFKVFGDGPYLERFKEFAKDCKVQVDFLGRLEYSLMVSHLTHCDIAVNPISKGAAQSIINKHADYAASGLPVVSTQESAEYRNLVEKYEFGINCGVESVEDVANALLSLISNAEMRETMGRNSRKLAEEKFDRKTSYTSIVEDVKRFFSV